MTAGARRGLLVVLAGPSGVGKSSVVTELRRVLPQLNVSVSVTTRNPRPGEVDGRDYRFVDPPTFDRMIADGSLLEWSDIHGGLHRSGTPREPVERHLAAGEPVLLEVDLHGARAVKQALPDALLVFLEPPSWAELARRLTERGTEPDDVVTRRLSTARAELAAKTEFDVVVVNDELRRVVDTLVNLVSDKALRPGAGHPGPQHPGPGRPGSDDTAQASTGVPE